MSSVHVFLSMYVLVYQLDFITDFTLRRENGVTLGDVSGAAASQKLYYYW